MNLEVICIGDEILIGHTVNTNLTYIGRKLVDLGHRVARETCIPDTFDGIVSAVAEAAGRADVVVTVGGLGPTSDDITRDAVAAAVHCPLEYQSGAYDAIRNWLGERSVRVPDDAIRRQARVPSGGELIPNRNGTAPGLWVEAGNAVVVCLPGPPRELQPMMEATVLPRLRERFPPAVLTCTIPTAGIPESVLATKLEDVLHSRHPTVQPAYCAGPNRVDVRLTAAADQKEALHAAEAATRQVLAAGVLPEEARNLPEAIGILLRQRSWTLATAESCTGGAIAHEITDVPGCSDYFAGGFVTYSNSWKEQCLGVPRATLEAHGAVSEQTAAAMLEGLHERTGVESGIAVTGIAGPGGGTADKPVGLVYIGTRVPGRNRVTRHVFPGNRDAVRRRTVIVALNQLREHINTEH